MPEKKLNIHEKLLKIADMSGVLRKNKSGFNYKYTTEDEIQAKITAGMQKYGVMLYPSLVPGSLSIIPYHYDKPKTKKEGTKTVEYTVPVNEVIVHAEVIYTWVNTESPEEKIESHWAYIGQMEDASQAFGSGATYGNRYYLMKALQLATTEADPDAYRTKQKEAEGYENEKLKKEEAEALEKTRKTVVQTGSELIKAGYSKDDIMNIVAKHNNGNKNPSSIASMEICEAVMDEFKLLKTKAEKPATSKKAAQKGE